MRSEMSPPLEQAPASRLQPRQIARSPPRSDRSTPFENIISSLKQSAPACTRRVKIVRGLANLSRVRAGGTRDSVSYSAGVTRRAKDRGFLFDRLEYRERSRAYAKAEVTTELCILARDASDRILDAALHIDTCAFGRGRRLAIFASESERR